MTVKLYDVDGYSYLLRKELLTEVDSDGHYIRSVYRKQVAKVFRGTQDRIDAMTSGGVSKYLWQAKAGKTVLHIGCRTFRGSSVKTIRTWALARKKKS